MVLYNKPEIINLASGFKNAESKIFFLSVHGLACSLFSFAIFAFLIFWSTHFSSIPNKRCNFLISFSRYFFSISNDLSDSSFKNKSVLYIVIIDSISFLELISPNLI
ncbi:hypothetical protein oki361_18040 [Helicobacter pylori]|jgi:hypothetical protein